MHRSSFCMKSHELSDYTVIQISGFSFDLKNAKTEQESDNTPKIRARVNKLPCYTQ